MLYPFPSWDQFSRIFKNKYDTFWWFGENYYRKYGDKWPLSDQTESPEGYVYPSISDFKTVAMLALTLYVVRFLFEKVIAEPIGKWFGLKHYTNSTPPGPNKKLEALIAKTKKPNKKQIEEVAKLADMEIRDVEVWIRRRLREITPSQLTKFKETMWRFVFYSSICGYGISIMWNQDYLWNTMLCWVGYPDLTWAVPNCLYYYYMVSGAFYLSLLVSQFHDTKRKDFWEMFLHHIATLSLIGGSWIGGGYRMGSIILVIHDVADVFLETAKLGIYLKWEMVSNVCFAGFTLSWILLRLIFYPYKVITSSLFESTAVLGVWPANIVYGLFLIVLQVLHIYWFTFIVKLLVKILGSNDDTSVEDNRSEDEEIPSSSEEDKKDQ